MGRSPHLHGAAHGLISKLSLDPGYHFGLQRVDIQVPIDLLHDAGRLLVRIHISDVIGNIRPFLVCAVILLVVFLFFPSDANFCQPCDEKQGIYRITIIRFYIVLMTCARGADLYCCSCLKQSLTQITLSCIVPQPHGNSSQPGLSGAICDEIRHSLNIDIFQIV